MATETVYAELTAALKRVHALGTLVELLGWDEQVNLPEGAAEQRAGQQAALAEALHAAASDAKIGGLGEPGLPPVAPGAPGPEMKLVFP